MTEETRALVLVVDDEADLRAVLDFNLRQAGFATAHAATGSEALARARELRPRVVLLDLNLPDLSGTDVCRVLKADPATAAIPILMLTARGTEEDRVLGLELGADDYVVKPFSVRELVLRVRVLAQRLTRGPNGGAMYRTPFRVDLGAHVARVRGVEVALTVLEFRLLAFLLEGRGRVRTREQLLEHVWQVSVDVETRAVDTTVKRLRHKLGEAGEVVETVRGIGYRVRQPGD